MAQKWIIPIIVAAAMVCAYPSAAEDTSRTTIAVAAEGDTADARVSDIGARAPYFLMFDEQGQFAEALANPHQAPRRAGRRLVEWLAPMGVRTIIAGAFGDRMSRVMADMDITQLTAAGSAAEAVKEALSASPENR